MPVGDCLPTANNTQLNLSNFTVYLGLYRFVHGWAPKEMRLATCCVSKIKNAKLLTSFKPRSRQHQCSVIEYTQAHKRETSQKPPAIKLLWLQISKDFQPRRHISLIAFFSPSSRSQTSISGYFNANCYLNISCYRLFVRFISQSTSIAILFRIINFNTLNRMSKQINNWLTSHQLHVSQHWKTNQLSHGRQNDRFEKHIMEAHLACKRKKCECGVEAKSSMFEVLFFLSCLNQSMFCLLFVECRRETES